MLKEKIVTVAGKTYKFTQPSVTQSSIGDMEFSKAYMNALTNGLLPKVVVERKLIEIGAWKEEDEQMIRDLSDGTQEALKKMIETKDKNEKDTYLYEYYDYRNRLMSKAAEKQGMLNHSAESKGDEAKIIYLMSVCVLSEDGSKIWSNKEELLESTQDNTVLVTEFVSYLMGLDEKIASFEQVIASSYETKEEETKEETKQEVSGGVQVV